MARLSANVPRLAASCQLDYMQKNKYGEQTNIFILL